MFNGTETIQIQVKEQNASNLNIGMRQKEKFLFPSLVFIGP